MWEQVVDLQEEGAELHDFLAMLDEADWERSTPFKSWTVSQVVEHLHYADKLTMMTLNEPEQFVAWRDGGRAPMSLPGGRALLGAWWDTFNGMCEALGAADPRHRIAWFGPDMSLRSCATARQMETWAHGQDIYDLKRVARAPAARLRNIAHLGVVTYGWTFANRGLDAPEPAPHVRLDAPDGSVWEWNAPSDADYVRGSALEFCHVVTQGRNVHDTALEYSGTAAEWMPIAQCFAGPPETPPAPGERVFASQDG